MLLEQHLPFLARQLPDALLAYASCVERHLRARLAIDIGPGIDGVCQNLVDGVIARLHPADFGMGVHLQRQLEAPIAKPQPPAAGGTHLRKTVEDGADRSDDGLVGVEQPARSMRRCQSALLRARRDTSRPSTRPTRASATSAVSRAKPDRATEPEPDRPRSSSMTRMRSSGQPSSRALAASAYCRSVDSRLCSTCAALDWRR